MARIENPIPDLIDAGGALAKIVALQKDLFVLNQELKTIRQIKLVAWLVAGLVFLNLLLNLAFYWVGVGLHERGWSPYSLALLTIVGFGIIVAFCLFMAIRVSHFEPKRSDSRKK